MAVDRVGRVYVGALNLRPPTPDGVAGPASLVLVENDATVRVVATGLRFPNGLAFTGDAGDTWDAGGTGDTRETGRLLVVDSEFGSVLSYRVGVHGELSDRRIFAQWDDAVPDGLAVGRDATGCPGSRPWPPTAGVSWTSSIRVDGPVTGSRSPNL